MGSEGPAPSDPKSASPPGRGFPQKKCTRPALSTNPVRKRLKTRSIDSSARQRRRAASSS